MMLSLVCKYQCLSKAKHNYVHHIMIGTCRNWAGPLEQTEGHNFLPNYLKWTVEALLSVRGTRCTRQIALELEAHTIPH